MPRAVSHAGLLRFDEAKAVGFRFLFGVDEAGRGPLAGPVVAAAVCVRDPAFDCRIGDSKLLTRAQRERAFALIHVNAFVGVGVVSEAVIDEINILRAAHLAMTMAVLDLVPRVAAPQAGIKVLIDGNSYEGDIPHTVECVVKGDSKSFAIACASIIAKVTRDRMMDEYDALYPQYGFAAHKGYPVPAHYDALRKCGPAPIHRKSFRLV